MPLLQRETMKQRDGIEFYSSIEGVLKSKAEYSSNNKCSNSPPPVTHEHACKIIF